MAAPPPPPEAPQSPFAPPPPPIACTVTFTDEFPPKIGDMTATVPDTLIIFVSALVEEREIFPDKEPDASAVVLTNTVVAANVPEAVMLTEDPNPVPAVLLTSNPFAALTTTLFLRLLPETVNDCSADEAPAQAEKPVKVATDVVIMEPPSTSTALVLPILFKPRVALLPAPSLRVPPFNERLSTVIPFRSTSPRATLYLNIRVVLPVPDI